MRQQLRLAAMALGWLAVVPAAAHAQASITGVVRDASGAVLPGVTVEAASPALIEKVRSVVSDGTGQYRLENLSPGLYTVTFTLPGFATVKREGIELSGSFTASVNADLRVGALEETITVSGETPVVDVQSTTRQRAMDRDILDAIPTSQTAMAVGVLIPGVNFERQNVGGVEAQWGRLSGSLSAHGGGNSNAGTTLGGLSVSTLASSAATATIRFNPLALQEITVDTGAVSAQMEGGGVRVNYVPREGGNTYNGVLFGAFANSSLQADNFTQELKDRGLSTPNGLDSVWNVNAGFGGPIRRDRLWFYGASQYDRASQFVAGLFYNRNANRPDAWTFDPDPNRAVVNEARNPDAQLRVTWQATPKHKIGLLAYNTTFCFCPNAAATTALESQASPSYPVQRLVQLDWTAPVTNRVLYEGGANVYFAESNAIPWTDLNPALIGITEQSSGLSYRSGSNAYRIQKQRVTQLRGAASYITGAHVIKVGFNHKSGHLEFNAFDLQPLNFRLNNGVPNQLTQRAFPFTRRAQMDHDMGLYVQNKWTLAGLTLNYGVRYDYVANGFPEQHVGPAALAPRRDITFPAQSNIGFQDITPKLGASYDLFGTGKTAVKVSINKYLAVIGIDSTFGGDANPVNNLVTETTRSWTDANGNFTPDCDLTNPNQNGECGRLANTDFGGSRPGATYDRELLRGWGRRSYNWELSAGIQQEVLPRLSVDVTYFRNWFGNFAVTDNLAVAASDYDAFSIIAPSDPRLPGGGGYRVSGLFDLNPAKFGVPANNLVTRARKYGEQMQYWQGVDVNINARPGSGLLLQGGTSTGRTVADNCAIVAKLPEMLFNNGNERATSLPLAPRNGWTPQQFCRQTGAFLTQAKFLGSYTIPRVDVLVSGTLQSLPGPPILAAYNAPNSVVAPSLGRSLSGSAANITVNLVEPGTMNGERMNQLDLRVAKLLRFGRTRTRLNVDVYNALNSSAVLTQNSSFGVWQQPTLILVARFVKFSAQIDF